MYLHKRTYVKNWDHFTDKERFKINITRKSGHSIQIDRISDVIEEVAYWRKANHIHAWFVENVQSGNDDCGEYYVGVDQLRELVSECKAVLASRELAPERLPRAEGFFFGSNDYDAWYFQACENTIEMLEPCLDGGDYYYSSSW